MRGHLSTCVYHRYWKNGWFYVKTGQVALLLKHSIQSNVSAIQSTFWLNYSVEDSMLLQFSLFLSFDTALVASVMLSSVICLMSSSQPPAGLPLLCFSLHHTSDNNFLKTMSGSMAKTFLISWLQCLLKVSVPSSFKTQAFVFFSVHGILRILRKHHISDSQWSQVSSYLLASVFRHQSHMMPQQMLLILPTGPWGKGDCFSKAWSSFVPHCGR